jgi:hypothetical protein
MLLQVVPSLPPRVDGIGDYALRLALALRERHGVETIFLAADTGWREAGGLEGFRGIAVSAHTPEALLAALAQCEQMALAMGDGALEVLVHVSPYGYEKRGVPTWFVEGWERFAARQAAKQGGSSDGRGRIHSCFHELERTGAPVWSSGFWVPPLQRRLLVRMARLSRVRYTNTEGHRQRLESWGAGRTDLIPNFSTMPEPRVLEDTPRRRELVVFARQSHRRLTYTQGGRTLQALCQRIGIERIVDIGTPIADLDLAAITGVPVTVCGHLPPEQVLAAMQQALGTFVWYPAIYLTKSSVHAVASSCGAVTFLYDDSPEEHSCPGLEPGLDFVPITADADGFDPAAFTTAALAPLHAAIHRSYLARASWAAADRLAQQIFGGSA